MADPLPLDNLLTRLFGESHDVALLWQLGVLLACGLAAWGMLRLVRYWLEKPVSTWSAGRAGVRRVTAPLLMLLAVLVAREVADLWLADTHLLNLAVPLLLSLVLVRLIVYSLRYVFQGSDSIRIWERTAAWLIWGAFALYITGLLPRIHAAMEALSFGAGSHRYSLWLLLQAVAMILAAVIISLALARLVEGRLLRMEHMNLSLRMALAKAARTVLLILAVLVALPMVGIDITVLSVFGGALGVGIGFGLQKVASNYISGFIILLDRSVRIGDLITVDNRYGEVEEINTRYTLIRSVDGTESIVPNENLITETVVNHSLSQPAVRVALPVQVSYDADVERAQALMLEAARGHPRVIQDEADKLPRVFLKEFADNGIALELGVWIRDPGEGQNNLRSDINWAIWRSFKAAGIQIPFPQRVVHLAAKEPADR